MLWLVVVVVMGFVMAMVVVGSVLGLRRDLWEVEGGKKKGNREVGRERLFVLKK